MGVYGKGRSRKLMIVLGLIALVSMLFSVRLSCAEKHHYCHGEDCPICACLHHCRESIRDLSDAIVPPVIVLFVPVAAQGIKALFLCAGICYTPVGLKVRLND